MVHGSPLYSLVSKRGRVISTGTPETHKFRQGWDQANKPARFWKKFPTIHEIIQLFGKVVFLPNDDSNHPTQERGQRFGLDSCWIR